MIPVKDERDNVRPLHDRLHAALQPMTCEYELIFVDDGSTDGTHAELEQLARGDQRVKVVSLRRNFGQTPALVAGIDHSSGDIIVTMDGDLQNDPADIPVLVSKLDEGYDAVFGYRKNRQDGLLLRKFPSRIANWLIRKVTGVQIRDLGCTIRALRRDLATSLPLYGELHRFVPVLAQQCGAKMTQIEVRHHPRVAGKTKYNLSRTVRVLLDLITVQFLNGYVTRPMHALGVAGLGTFAASILCLLATIWMKAAGGTDMTGNPLLLLSVTSFLVGIQLISLGLLGELLARTYFESQGKSPYLVRSTLNLDPAPARQAA